MLAELGVSCPRLTKTKLWLQATRDLVRETHRGFHKHPIWDTCSGPREAKEKNRMSFGANTWAGARPDLVWQGRSCRAWHLIVYTPRGCVSTGGGGVYREGALHWPQEGRPVGRARGKIKGRQGFISFHKSFFLLLLF